jgi:hypothetical protein
MMKRCSLWGKNGNGTVKATEQIHTVFFYHGRIGRMGRIGVMVEFWKKRASKLKN